MIELQNCTILLRTLTVPLPQLMEKVIISPPTSSLKKLLSTRETPISIVETQSPAAGRNRLLHLCR